MGSQELLIIRSKNNTETKVIKAFVTDEFREIPSGFPLFSQSKSQIFMHHTY